ncbi:amine oxidase [Plectosphaerella cucumerina]|uniref:Amine oxidase n=1 Tax=Plectosphaerella cucumerina TaxID=40658 RepID=A0A8K0TJ41_9PEZI|nr:amine oxidase [Plectosphaerella cucumerina]
MALTLTSLFATFCLVAAAAISPDTIIEVDVAVLGGGASGAHAAVRLREDHGKSVIVVERQARLGGHVATFVDPQSGHPYNYGLNSFTEYGNAEAFFDRFNVTLMTPGRVPLTTTYADFESGEQLQGIVLPPPADTTAALRKYLALCEQYEHMILPSYEYFPGDIPEDLLLPFGDFVTGLGTGDMNEHPTLYVMQAFGAPITRSFVGLAGSFVPASGSNQELYDKIAALLGDDVLYSSTVAESERTSQGVTLSVKTAGQPVTTTIRAKRLLISFEPTLANLRGIDLDDDEREVFSKWLWSTVYVGIARSPALPVGGSLTNTPTSAVPSNWLSLPRNPFVGRFDWMGEENFRVLVTGTEETDSCDAQALVKETFRRLADAGTVEAEEDEKMELAAWADHGPMHLWVSSGDLAGGFIRRKYALQGRSSTFYTGAAWSAQFTTILWEYNDKYVLPRLLASLEE